MIVRDGTYILVDQGALLPLFAGLRPFWVGGWWGGEMFDRSTPRLISAWLPFPLGSFAPLHGDVERDKAGKMWMEVAKFDKFGRREMNCDAGECEEGWVDPFFCFAQVFVLSTGEGADACLLCAAGGTEGCGGNTGEDAKRGRRIVVLDVVGKRARAVE